MRPDYPDLLRHAFAGAARFFLTSPAFWLLLAFVGLVTILSARYRRRR